MLRDRDYKVIFVCDLKAAWITGTDIYSVQQHDSQFKMFRLAR